MSKIAVFASGRGSNFEAIYKACQDQMIIGDIVLVVCDKIDALVVKVAREKHLEVFNFDPNTYQSKAEYEAEIVDLLNQNQVDLVVLAGYMRLCGQTLLNAYEGKIINIHPSLLPAFCGKDAIGQAIDAGVKIMGVTIHFVDKGMDSGKIIAQEAFKVEGMNRDEIEAQMHFLEHQLYPKVINDLLKGAND